MTTHYLEDLLREYKGLVVRVQRRDYATNIARLFTFEEYVTKEAYKFENDSTIAYYFRKGGIDYQFNGLYTTRVMDEDKETVFQCSDWEMFLHLKK